MRGIFVILAVRIDTEKIGLTAARDTRNEGGLHMRNALLLILVVAIVFSFACGKKEEPAKTETVVKTQPKLEPRADRPEIHSARERTPLIDPVTGEAIAKSDSSYTYLYNGKTYFFESDENLELFKKDPEKYIKKLM